MGRLGGGESAGHKPLHVLNPGFVGCAVQPEAPRGSCRLQEPVALLPGPEQLGTDPGAFGQLTDTEVARSGVGRGLVVLLFVHTPTVQAIDDNCTDS